MLGAASAQVDPETGLDRLLAWSIPAKGETAAVELIQAWARREPHAASRAVDAVTDRALRESLTRSLITGWARSGDPSVANHLAQMPFGKQRTLLSNALVGVYFQERGPDGLMHWVESLPDDADAFKQTVFEHACRLLANEDPRVAVHWAERHTGRLYARGATRAVAIGWARRDGSASLEWLLRHSPGEERDEAVEAAFRRWSSSDAAAAQRWLETQDGNGGLDSAREVAATKLLPTSPELAMEWVDRIVGETRRWTVATQLVPRWLRTNPSAARAWLAGSDLPADMRSGIARAARKERRPEARAALPSPAS